MQRTLKSNNITTTGNQMRRVVSAWLAAFSLAALAVLTPAVASAGETKMRATSDFPSMRLKGNEKGEDAIRALGNKLPEVAKWYNKTPQEFTDTLRSDRHARIDREGRMYYVEAQLQASGATGTTATFTNSLAPPEQTFLLHSRPGAQRTIYLDFNGHLATGTAWNNSFGLSAIDASAFDLDANPGSFSAAELNAIQYIWQRVAEDYAAFDVNVTTQEPPADALSRTSSTDQTFGTRTVITADWTVNTASPCGCGGFAYVGAFDDTTEFYKPAYVFYNRLGSNEKFIAEAISHEVGHNLGLSHDGTTGAAYYTGHGSGATGWAPIMGVGYYKELVQWSKGEYPGANNTEDDIARIQMFGVPLRVDDHGGNFATATPLTAVTNAGVTSLSSAGVNSARADVDMFSFSSGPGTITLNLSPATRSPNLDISAELYDANGVLLATANPLDALSASIAVNSPNGGAYFLKIDGVGKGDLATGYSDYGSLGQYAINGSVPAANGQAPVAIAAATPISGTAPLTVNFSSAGSYDPDGSAISFSWNFGNGSALSSVANPSHLYSAAGSYVATLTVTDASGAASLAQLFITVTAGATPSIRVETIGMSLSVKRSGTRATATVTITDTSGKVISGATVNGSWSGVVSGSATASTSTNGQARLISPSTKSRGTFNFTVTGVASSGATYDAIQNKQTSAFIVY